MDNMEEPRVQRRLHFEAPSNNSSSYLGTEKYFDIIIFRPTKMGKKE